MPPSNFTKTTNPQTDDSDDYHSSGFSYDLLLLIVPMGLIVLLVLYMCIKEKIHNFRYPPIRINRSDSDFSINSRYSISSLYYQTNNNPYIPEKINKNLQNPEEITIVNENNSEYENKCCSICLEEYEIENKILKYPCEHIFHQKCIEKWIKSEVDKSNTPSCPNCRDVIKDINQN